MANLGNVYDDQKPTPPQQSKILDNVYSDQMPASSPPDPNMGNAYMHVAEAPSAGKSPLQKFVDAFNALKTQIDPEKRQEAFEEVINDVASSLANQEMFAELDKLIYSLNRIASKHR
jgi:hypothetical protein